MTNVQHMCAYGHVLVVNTAQLSSNAPCRRCPTMQDRPGLVADIRQALARRPQMKKATGEQANPATVAKIRTNYSDARPPPPPAEAAITNTRINSAQTSRSKE